MVTYFFISAWCSADPVICNGTSRSVSLVGCLLEDRGISYSDLHLYDKTCKGELDPVTHMVTLGFDSKTKPCGTVIKVRVKQPDVTQKKWVWPTARHRTQTLVSWFPVMLVRVNVKYNNLQIE